ncbi:MAG TPA: hypothetical protein PKC65_13345 [Pyrinomonadaceae bacterium]|nr:hypothetical protein [Pyrinomonadaceae bacterium]
MTRNVTRILHRIDRPVGSQFAVLISKLPQIAVKPVSEIQLRHLSAAIENGLFPQTVPKPETLDLAVRSGALTLEW